MLAGDDVCAEMPVVFIGKAARYISNAYTGQYLGESVHARPHDVAGARHVFVTEWTSQPDKGQKFLWTLESPNSSTAEAVLSNVETGHVLRDTEDDFNDVGDTFVVAATDDATPACRWHVRADSGGGDVRAFSLVNVGTGSVLGASKKWCNSRGDCHVLCSPEAKHDPSILKWRWNLFSS